MRATCHACGDNVIVEDGEYNDHGACDASGKPVPMDVVLRPVVSVYGTLAEVDPRYDDKWSNTITVQDGTTKGAELALSDGEAEQFMPFIGRRVRITVEVLP